MNVNDLLFHHFLKYQERYGELKTQGDFAKFLGISQTALTMFWNGTRKLSKQAAYKMASRLDDDRFYEAAGIKDPDIQKMYLDENWDKLPDETKKRISDIAQRYKT